MAIQVPFRRSKGFKLTLEELQDRLNDLVQEYQTTQMKMRELAEQSDDSPSEMADLVGRCRELLSGIRRVDRQISENVQ